MCRGALVCLGGLCSLLQHNFCLGCVEPLPLPMGSETCFSSSDLALCLSFGFRSLVDVSFSCLFCFPFLSSYQMCVLSMHSSRGGGIEDHVSFEDQWMVASWCDE
jgi:hypothetical protein